MIKAVKRVLLKMWTDGRFAHVRKKHYLCISITAFDITHSKYGTQRTGNHPPQKS